MVSATQDKHDTQSWESLEGDSEEPGRSRAPECLSCAGPGVQLQGVGSWRLKAHGHYLRSSLWWGQRLGTWRAWLWLLPEGAAASEPWAPWALRAASPCHLWMPRPRPAPAGRWRQELAGSQLCAHYRCRALSRAPRRVQEFTAELLLPPLAMAWIPADQCLGWGVGRIGLFPPAPSVKQQSARSHCGLIKENDQSLVQSVHRTSDIKQFRSRVNTATRLQGGLPFKTGATSVTFRAHASVFSEGGKRSGSGTFATFHGGHLVQDAQFTDGKPGPEGLGSWPIGWTLVPGLRTKGWHSAQMSASCHLAVTG